MCVYVRVKLVCPSACPAFEMNKVMPCSLSRPSSRAQRPWSLVASNRRSLAGGFRGQQSSQCVCVSAKCLHLLPPPAFSEDFARWVTGLHEDTYNFDHGSDGHIDCAKNHHTYQVDVIYEGLLTCCTDLHSGSLCSNPRQCSDPIMRPPVSSTVAWWLFPYE